jgi:hypothetical protein
VSEIGSRIPKIAGSGVPFAVLRPFWADDGQIRNDSNISDGRFQHRSEGSHAFMLKRALRPFPVPAPRPPYTRLKKEIPKLRT